MVAPVFSDRVATVRSFNRFFTRQIGVLREGLLHSEFTLTEMRVLYELAHHGDQPSAALCRDLGLDRGYLSRIVAKFESAGLVSKVPSTTDGRSKLLHLTEQGRAVYEPLDRRSREEVGDMLSRFGDADQLRMLDAMRTIRELLDTESGLKYAQPFVLRAHRAGDMAWITRRHGELYATQQGWDRSFETLVGQICADFERDFDPALEHCWIAEMNGQPVGSIALARSGEDGVAKLRLLLVEEQARGYGLGSRLVDECHRFAREAGYRKMRLWTTDQQKEARHIYQSKGYVLVAEEPVHAFGKDMVNETWELDLMAICIASS
ncbi:GNAT family N-acetyltransferase [Duganella sp. FT109W]|uniref:GNAT family N-acetyltransferase n=1 Tax=Duganella margarita TaxID=2692170 RepID=A0ABW9WG38_9BURK|nr:bifunctional helix-turn-helix transcriptional regulator/GNAT family N-acetyltransferase [Duganella margarita]MYN40077.1 GNAT family N-acetyltransferase [Duganella margarita]